VSVSRHYAVVLTRARARLLVTLLLALAGLWGPWGVFVPGATASAASTVAEIPTPAVLAVSEGSVRYFPQTAHFLRGVFLSFWETHGGVDVLGLPITEPLVEDGLSVQYLERARLEWHPENAEARNRVQLTRLGAVRADSQNLTFDRATPAQGIASTFYFVETGHNLSNAFLSYWLHNGGLAVFGYPISEELVETNAADGQRYTVQYFERNRFEWHPENPPAFNVQLGLLGVEYARTRNLDPLARVIVPEPVPGSDGAVNQAKLAQLVDADLIEVVNDLGKTPQFSWVPAILVQYNIPVEFANIGENGVAGAFVSTRSRTRPYVIVVPESERNESPLALASVLAHEATHAYDVMSGVANPRLSCSVEEELRAYMNGLASWVVLQGPDALSKDYPSGSLDAAVNHSLVDFNGGSTDLTFDFDVQEARSFIRDLYGSSCGQ
jgi:hypothetical protein